jgi:23S rRNA (pseudouridine1915-N3)-methyltransferase
LKLRIVALGARMPAWVDAAYADYAKRLPRGYAVDLVELKPAPRGRGRAVEQILEVEAQRIDAACDGYRLIACDERGRAWSTRDLARELGRWHDDDEKVSFVIGSADGLAQRIRIRASNLLSLSALTLPHALVRIVLVEQIYRAASLIGGHPYHRE